MSPKGVHLPPSRNRRPGMTRPDQPGAVLRCVLLASGCGEWVAVEVQSGALVRSHAPRRGAVENEASVPDRPLGHAVPLEVIDIEIGVDDEPPDPSRPEAIAVAGPPNGLGRGRRRAMRSLLASLVPHDASRPLLGSLGPSIAYADLDGTRPSVTVIHPDRAPQFGTEARGSWCQFTLGGRKHRLSVTDERVIAATSGRRGEVLGADAVVAALGGPVHYLVVGLGSPVAAQAPKLVLGALPRP